MSWLDRITAARPSDLFGVSVLKDAPAALAAPVLASKPHVDQSRMCVTAVLTSRTPDRQGDIVDPLGGNFEEHRTNPVVLFHHAKQHKLPIGKAEDRDGNYTVRVVKARDGDVLVGTTHFAQSNRFAQDVFGLIAEDVLRGVSIGFDPINEEGMVSELGPECPALKRPPLHFKGWTLLEYSHTPIGVNRDALTVAVQKALDGSRPLDPRLVAALQPMAQPRGTVVAVEKGFKDNLKRSLKRVGQMATNAGIAATNWVSYPARPHEWGQHPSAGVAHQTSGTRVPGPVRDARERSARNTASSSNPAVKAHTDANAESIQQNSRVAKPGAKIVGQPRRTAPTGVTKAMDDELPEDPNATMPQEGDEDQGDYDDPGAPGAGGYDPATDDPSDDPALAGTSAGQYVDAEDEMPPPTVQTLTDGAQGLLDLCAAIQMGMKKSEHMKGRKYAAKVCADLQAMAAEVNSFAQKVHAELQGSPDGGMAGEETAEDDADTAPGDDGDDADPRMADSSAPPEPPETDDDGAIVTKGYSPRRFTFADLTGAAPVAPAGRPENTKAMERENARLQRENRELADTLNNLLDDIEAARGRDR